MSAKDKPSSSPAVTGRELHYKSFRHELYYRATPHRFPQAPLSRPLLSTKPFIPMPFPRCHGERRGPGASAGLAPMGLAAGMYPSPGKQGCFPGGLSSSPLGPWGRGALCPHRQMCRLLAIFPFCAFSFSPGASSQPRLHWAGASPASCGQGMGLGAGKGEPPPQTGKKLLILDLAAWLHGGGWIGALRPGKHLPADGPRGSRESAGTLRSRRQGRDGEAGFLLLSGCPPAPPPLLPVPRSTFAGTQHPQAPMLSPASPYQGTPPSLPTASPPRGVGPCGCHPGGAPLCPHTPALTFVPCG